MPTVLSKWILANHDYFIILSSWICCPLFNGNLHAEYVVIKTVSFLISQPCRIYFIPNSQECWVCSATLVPLCSISDASSYHSRDYLLHSFEHDLRICPCRLENTCATSPPRISTNPWSRGSSGTNAADMVSTQRHRANMEGICYRLSSERSSYDSLALHQDHLQSVIHECTFKTCQ